MLERNVEIGQHDAIGHQLDHVIDMRTGVHVMRPDPRAERAELAGEIEELGADVAILPSARGIFDVDAIG